MRSGSGISPARPVCEYDRRVDNLSAEKLWSDTGLVEAETRRIDVQRRFADFDDFWDAVAAAPTLGDLFAKMTPDALARLKAREARVHEDGTGRITCGAWANAIKGRLPER
jgi:hypothetical protein